MAKSIKLGADTYLDASGVVAGNVTLLNAFKVVRVDDRIGAMSAGSSGFRTLSATIPSGYKTTGITTIVYTHPGTSGFVTMLSIGAERTGTISIYVPYYCYKATGLNDSDYQVCILTIKSEFASLYA